MVTDIEFVKVKKLNLSLSTICRRIGGEEVQYQLFLNSAMDGGE